MKIWKFNNCFCIFIYVQSNSVRNQMNIRILNLFCLNSKASMSHLCNSVDGYYKVAIEINIK
jgi:hypothetical protein